MFAVALLDAAIIGAFAVSLSSAYAIGDVFGMNHSLHRGFGQAKGFYAIYAALVCGAAAVVLIPGSPLGLITEGVQVLAGVLLPSATVFLLLLCNDKAVLGPWVNGRKTNVFTATVISALITLSVILTVSVVFPAITARQILMIIGACAAAALVAGGALVAHGARRGRVADDGVAVRGPHDVADAAAGRTARAGDHRRPQDRPRRAARLPGDGDDPRRRQGRPHGHRALRLRSLTGAAGYDCAVPMSDSKDGPLAGVRVVELAGIGPGPFCGMLLADLGADVIVIDRPGGPPSPVPIRKDNDFLNRGKRRVIVDLKHPRGPEVVLRLAALSDALIEGYRPGVAERLGVGPADCWARNPRLVYGRMTGWGQDGPFAQSAGHDVAYIAVTGALHAIGRAGGPPQVPVNYLGDFGGGSMFLALGVVAALLRARATGRGQVVDAAIVDGAAVLQAMTYGSLADGRWADERGVEPARHRAPYYDVYATADGRYMAVGALERQFYAEFTRLLFAPEGARGPACPA